MVSTSLLGSSMLFSEESTSAGFLAQLDVLLELAQQAASEDLGLALADIGVIDGLDRGTNVPFLLDEALDLAALLAFDQHLDGAIRQLEQLQHGSDRTHAVQAIFARIIVRGVFCASRRICLSPVIAASRASMDFSRPTNNGMTMCGYTTTSRSGSKGNSTSVFIMSALQRHLATKQIGRPFSLRWG